MGATATRHGCRPRAAARLLSADGAEYALDGAAWNAAYGYYGHDATGVLYADQVLARAIGWSQHGFCFNCAVEPAMVDDDGVGVDDTADDCGGAVPVDAAGVTRVDAMTTTPAAAPAVMLPRKMNAATIG